MEGAAGSGRGQWLWLELAFPATEHRHSRGWTQSIMWLFLKAPWTPATHTAGSWTTSSPTLTPQPSSRLSFWGLYSWYVSAPTARTFTYWAHRLGSRTPPSSADSSGNLSLGRDMLGAPHVPASLLGQNHAGSSVHPAPLTSGALSCTPACERGPHSSSESFPRCCSSSIPMCSCVGPTQCTPLDTTHWSAPGG